MTAQGPFFLQHLKPFADLALKKKLPSFTWMSTRSRCDALLGGPDLAQSARGFDFSPFSGPLRRLVYWSREA
jgi:hypothetical protein